MRPRISGVVVVVVVITIITVIMGAKGGAAGVAEGISGNLRRDILTVTASIRSQQC